MKQSSFYWTLSSYFLAFFWVCAFFLGFGENPPYGILQLLFTAAFLLWGLAGGKSAAQDNSHWFWFTLTALVGLALGLNRCRAAQPLAYLALHGFAGYWLLSRSGCLGAGHSGILFPLDGLNAFVVLPFGNFFLRLRRMRQGLSQLCKGSPESGKSGRFGILWGIVAIVIAVPLLLAVGDLLGQADTGFARLTDAFLNAWTAPEWTADFLLRLVLSLPVGAYLFALAEGARIRKPLMTPEQASALAPRLRVAPVWSAFLILLGFLGMYAAFFCLQAGYLLSVFQGVVPGSLTAAGYAREGFFQLCQVMAINFFLLALVRLFVPSGSRGLRILLAALMVSSLGLAVTAAGKLVLYIHRFGFTPLRLLSAWAVVVLSAGCILAIASLFGKKETFRLWLALTAASFTALCFY